MKADTEKTEETKFKKKYTGYIGSTISPEVGVGRQIFLKQIWGTSYHQRV